MTTIAVVVLYGLGMAGLGAALVWRLRGDTIRVLESELKQARAAEAVATDRLVHAWREGATIAPRPAVMPPKPEPLPKDLVDEINQFEDPEHRANLESEFRRKLAQGMSTVAILLEQDNRHP